MYLLLYQPVPTAIDERAVLTELQKAQDNLEYGYKSQSKLGRNYI